MILYNPEHKASMLEFGIEIPISDSRMVKTFEALKSHAILGPLIQNWHIPKIDETVTRADLLRVHAGAYIDKLFSEKLADEIIKTYELIDAAGSYHRYSPAKGTLALTQLFDRILLKVSGTCQCCRIALQKSFCFYFGGGMHHAQETTGNGFCLLNDIVIAIRKLQAENLIKTAWVIDVDAHKGDGTAALTHKDPSVATLSIHMARGWPLDGDPYDRMGNLNPSFIPSDVDIPIVAGKEHLYLPHLEKGLETLDRLFCPDLAVVVSGADPYEKDALPSTRDLKLSLAQLKQRDLLVYEFLKKRNIPRAYLMAGGYGEETWQVYTQFLQWALLDNMA